MPESSCSVCKSPSPRPKSKKLNPIEEDEMDAVDESNVYGIEGLQRGRAATNNNKYRLKYQLIKWVLRALY